MFFQHEKISTQHTFLINQPLVIRSCLTNVCQYFDFSAQCRIPGRWSTTNLNEWMHQAPRLELIKHYKKRIGRERKRIMNHLSSDVLERKRTKPTNVLVVVSHKQSSRWMHFVTNIYFVDQHQHWRRMNIFSWIIVSMLFHSNTRPSNWCWFLDLWVIEQFDHSVMASAIETLSHNIGHATVVIPGVEPTTPTNPTFPNGIISTGRITCTLLFIFRENNSTLVFLSFFFSSPWQQT